MTKEEADKVKARKKARDAAKKVRAASETLAPMLRKVVNDDLAMGLVVCLDIAAVIAVKGMESNQADRTKLVAAFAETLEAWATKEESHG